MNRPCLSADWRIRHTGEHVQHGKLRLTDGI